MPPATTVDVLANDTDVEGDPITIELVTQPTNGVVVVTERRRRPHLPAEPELLQRRRRVPPRTRSLTPSTGGSEATVSVTVTCVADDPTAVDDEATVTEDDPATVIDVLANDLDPDGGR